MSFDALEKSVLQCLRGVRQRVVLAVSGGADSMVLLHAAARVAPSTVAVVATFDHGTGEAARRAANMVVAEANRLQFRVVAARARAALRGEAAWRTARWEFLRMVARDCGDDNVPLLVATAHTRDDQIETVVMRTLRHTGARGLAALYANSDTVRPILEHSRADVLQYALRHSVNFVDDPSNESRSHLRNRVRLEILPALRTVDSDFDDAMLRISRSAAAWRTEVDSLVRVIESGRGGARPAFRVDSLADYSSEELAVLAQAIAARAGVRLDRRGTLRLAAFLARSKARGRIQLSGAHEAERVDGLLRFLSGTGGGEPSPTVMEGDFVWGAFRFTRARPGTLWRGAWGARLPSGANPTIRAWQPGDRIVAAGSERPRRVKRFLSDSGIAGTDRRGWPVVLLGETVAWIPGVARSAAVDSSHSDLLADASSGGNAELGVAYVCERIGR